MLEDSFLLVHDVASSDILDPEDGGIPFLRNLLNRLSSDKHHNAEERNPLSLNFILSQVILSMIALSLLLGIRPSLYCLINIAFWFVFVKFCSLSSPSVTSDN